MYPDWLQVPAVADLWTTHLPAPLAPGRHRIASTATESNGHRIRERQQSLVEALRAVRRL